MRRRGRFVLWLARNGLGRRRLSNNRLLARHCAFRSRRRRRHRTLRSPGRRRDFLFADARLALEIAHFILERKAKIVGHFPEFRRGFPKHAGEFRQLLRAKNNQGHDEKYD